MRTSDLVRTRWLALALLLGAGTLYGVASLWQGRHPGWAYVAAFSEAAMIGAIADWFAIVALFRHPLGLPIPHTAIIPRNKDRIGEKLAAFICENFLGTQQVLQKIERFGAAARLAGWLADPRQAEQTAKHLAAALDYALGALDDSRVQHFFRATVVEQLGSLDAAQLSARLLRALTADGRHQGLVDALLRKLAALLDDELLKARMADVIAAEVKVLRIVGLDHMAGRYAASKLVSGLIRLVGEMADAPDHPLRQEVDAFISTFIGRLNDDAELRAKVESFQQQVLASATLSAYLQGLWSDVVGWMRKDLHRVDSLLHERAAAGLQLIGEKLQGDPQMQRWIDDQLLSAAPRWIERYREDIRATIVARVGDWSADEMSDELERNIGRDLQFIRINGTLVGGLVGLCIYALTQWARG